MAGTILDLCSHSIIDSVSMVLGNLLSDWSDKVTEDKIICTLTPYLETNQSTLCVNSAERHTGEALLDFLVKCKVL